MTCWQLVLLLVRVASLVARAGAEFREGGEDSKSCSSDALAHAHHFSGGEALLQIRSSGERGSATAEAGHRSVEDSGKLTSLHGQRQHPEPAAAGESGAKEEGDPHYTTHGCQCKSEWSFGGETLKGCSDTKAEFAKDYAWCMVTSDCDEPAGTDNGGEWDFCSLDKEVTHLRTQHGCHCAPHFSYNNTMWESCSKTSQGPKWCYVFESDQLCPESLRTEHHGAHWDYCFTTDQASPYLSSHGCHCMPEYYIGEELFKGCADIEVNGKKMNGCIVLEDGASCHGSIRMEGSAHEVDVCAIIEGDSKNQTLSKLDTALSYNCHCQPTWWHNGEEYNGCASTPDKNRKWCFLLEDSRLCGESDGIVTEDGSKQRWKFCEEAGEEAGEKDGEGDGKDKNGYRIVPVIVPVADSVYKSKVVDDAARNRGELGRMAEEDGAAAQQGLAALPQLSSVVAAFLALSILSLLHSAAV